MKIAIIGASGHGRVVIDAITKGNAHTIECLLDSGREVGDEISGYRVFGGVKDFGRAISELDIKGVVICVGDNATRKNIYSRISNDLGAAVKFVTVIHPSATIADDVVLGEGVVILAGAIVNTGAKIGNGGLLNTNCSLDHDCVMNEFSSLAPGAVVGGNVDIGAETAISLGAKVCHGLKIGAQTVVGAGAVVVKNIPNNSVAFGVPARVIRSRTRTDPYL